MTTACVGRAMPIAKLAAQPCPTAGRGVEWYGPTSDRDRQRLSTWCESVGGAVIRAPRAGTSSEHSGDLAIVTWNVHEGTGNVERLVASLRPSPFVILLQEAMRRGDDVPLAVPSSVDVPKREPAGDERGENIVRVADTLGLWIAYVPSMRNGRDVREDRGNAILSNVPLADARAIELPWVHQRRVAIVATVTARVDGAVRPLRVVSAHLDNRPARGAQAASLASWLRDTLSDGQTPLVVGGDLNTWFGAREEAVRRIDEVVPLVRECGSRATGRFGRRLDHLFSTLPVSARRGCEVSPSTLGSDHRFLRLNVK